MTSRPTPAELEKLVCDILSSFGPDRDSVRREVELAALDLDSLDLVELAQVLEDDHDIVLGEKTLINAELVIVGDVVDAVVDHAR